MARRPVAGVAETALNVTERLYQPTAHECVLLLLRLIQAKGEESGRAVTRARLTEATLRHLWIRSRITDDLLGDVQEILAHAGWTLFWTGSSYAIAMLDAINGWARISAKRLEAELEQVKRGKYDKFADLEKLLLGDDDNAEADDELDE
jgi:hypothetical protein